MNQVIFDAYAPAQIAQLIERSGVRKVALPTVTDGRARRALQVTARRQRFSASSCRSRLSWRWASSTRWRTCT